MALVARRLRDFPGTVERSLCIGVASIPLGLRSTVDPRLGGGGGLPVAAAPGSESTGQGVAAQAAEASQTPQAAMGPMRIPNRLPQASGLRAGKELVLWHTWALLRGNMEALPRLHALVVGQTGH